MVGGESVGCCSAVKVGSGRSGIVSEPECGGVVVAVLCKSLVVMYAGVW